MNFKYFFCIVISFLLFFVNVCASSYTQGVVKYGSYIYSDNQKKDILTSDTGGKIKLFTKEAVEVIDETEKFYLIKFLYTGFVYKGYIEKEALNVKEYQVDDEYTNSLYNLGFPLDYAKKLTILHAIHPNWTFTPSFTNGEQGGMDFNTAVLGEADVIARNLIDSKNTSLRSTDDGAYSNGEWISLSGKGWYAASTQTISFYMDPRNFLDESHIFMFENLGYNPNTQKIEVVDKIIKNTFMNNPFDCRDGANGCTLGVHHYRDTFMKSAEDKKVSPVHLATRVVQEQGSRGSVLSLGMGYNGEYIGYYNFFNIAASGISTEDVIRNGFKYAVNKNWNNQHISIYDGANKIASNYIKRNQNTQYYQKFNTVAPPIYGNQYMQNVRAPYSESYQTYLNYYSSFETQEEWNNGIYDFLIPVYKNMGISTTLDTSFNADATLKSLDIKSCTLNPSFQSSAYNYDCYIKNDVDEIEVNAIPTNPNAKAKYDKKVKLTDANTSIDIIVIACNGNESKYTVNIHKIKTDGYKPNEILEGIGIKTNGSTAYNIELGSDISNITNAIKGKYHFALIKIIDKNGKEIKEGIVKTGDKVEISNAGITTLFTIVIYGDPNGDGLIDIRDLLLIQKHLLKSKKLDGSYQKSADINKDDNIDIRDLLLVQKHLLKAYSISQG